jgi:hypothetical protein
MPFKSVHALALVVASLVDRRNASTIPPEMY